MKIRLCLVVDLIIDRDVELVLNNKTKLILCPEQLYTSNDALYVKTGEHRIKFTDRALVKLSKFMEEEEGALTMVLNGKTYTIVDKEGIDKIKGR